jgi:hypothetical protein
MLINNEKKSKEKNSSSLVEARQTKIAMIMQRDRIEKLRIKSA